MGGMNKPWPGFGDQVRECSPYFLNAAVSGEITATKRGIPLGMALVSGKVTAAVLALGDRGVDSSNPLKMELDIKKNGTSIFTTKPSIMDDGTGGVATSRISGEGIMPAVLDESRCVVAAGDVFTADLSMTRTASPTSEMKNPVIVLELRAIS
jgi:hypothetical protein